MEGSVVVLIGFFRRYFVVISSFGRYFVVISSLFRHFVVISSLFRRYFVVSAVLHVQNSRDVLFLGKKSACGTLPRSQKS